MTHSTLTWYSNVIKPRNNKEDWFILASENANGVEVYWRLYYYNEERDGFEHRSNTTDVYAFIPRAWVAYWAYVPMYLNFLREGKQSQIPEEK